MIDRLLGLESRQEELQERLATVPADIPDILPNVVGIYRRKVARLTEALCKPEEPDVAASTARWLIGRIVLTPGEKQGHLGTILDWTGNGTEKGKPATPSSGMWVSVVVKAGFEPATCRL